MVTSYNLYFSVLITQAHDELITNTNVKLPLRNTNTLILPMYLLNVM